MPHSDDGDGKDRKDRGEPATVARPAAEPPRWAAPMLAIYKNHCQHLWKWFRRRAGEETANDLNPQAFIEMNNVILEHGPPDDVPAELYKIGKNLVRRHHRELERLARHDDVEPEDLPSSTPSPEQKAHEGELRDLLELALRELPAAQAMLFRRIALAGETQPDVAESLGIPLGTVASRYRKAKMEVAALLRPYQADLERDP